MHIIYKYNVYVYIYIYCVYAYSVYIFNVSIYISEGSLEVKLPTVWTDEKQRW